MTSKVLVKIPGPSPFAQVNNVKKSPPEVIAGPQSGGGSLEAVLRVSQLEQNIRFLQEQHALLLTGLHREIENLRQKNKELQFQLVFSKRKSSLEDPNLPSTNDDDHKISPTSGDTSDKQYSAEDVTKAKTDKPCCRHLEKELTIVRAALEASQTRAADLQTQLNEYKKKEADAQKEASRRIAESWSSNTVSDVRVTTSTEADAEVMSPREEELKSRLTEAEKLVEGLRAQGERQRREVVEGGVTNLLFDTAPPVARNYLASIKASLSAAGRGNSGGGRNGGGNRGGGHQQRFPPLQNQPQTYWQQKEDSLEQIEHVDIHDSSPVRKHGGLKSCFVAFGRLSKSCAKPTASRDVVQTQNDTLTNAKVPQNSSVTQTFVKSAVCKLNSTTKSPTSSVKISPKRSSITPSSNSSTSLQDAKVPNAKNSDYGCWTRSNHRRSGDKNDSSHAPVLPDVRGTNAPLNYSNGNNGNGPQHGGRNGGNQGYSNQYFRNSDRGGGHRNSSQDDSYQKKNSNEDLSDGEVSSSQQQQQTSSRGGHSYTNSRHKRGHHRQYDNNS